MKKFFKILLAISLFNINTVYATSFVITDAQTNARTLANGEVGVINSGGSLTVSGPSIAAIEAGTAINVLVTNAGDIVGATLVDGILSGGGSGLIVNNSGSITVTGDFTSAVKTNHGGASGDTTILVNFVHSRIIILF